MSGSDDHGCRASVPGASGGSEGSETKCICKGNWRTLVGESEGLIGKLFANERGIKYRFFGLVHGSDDYYYGMSSREAGLALLSCVGSLETHGYVEVPEEQVSEDNEGVSP